MFNFLVIITEALGTAGVLHLLIIAAEAVGDTLDHAAILHVSIETFYTLPQLICTYVIILFCSINVFYNIWK